MVANGALCDGGNGSYLVTDTEKRYVGIFIHQHIKSQILCGEGSVLIRSVFRSFGHIVYGNYPLSACRNVTKCEGRANGRLFGGRGCRSRIANYA